MKRWVRAMCLVGLLILIVTTTSACFFEPSLEFNVFGGEPGIDFVSVSTNGTISPCEHNEQASTFICTYLLGGVEEDQIDSELGIFGAPVAGLLALIDPIVLQVPQGAHDFAGSYTDAASGKSGALLITAGLNSLAADAVQTIRAEAGMQLVLIELPADAPETGAFSLNLNFKIPSNLTSLPLKALFTGSVDANNTTYYPPIFPCTTDLSKVPSLSVKVPDGGSVSLPVHSVQGCDHATYTLTAPTFDHTMLLPLAVK